MISQLMTLLKQRLYWYWRLAATGFAFGTFGVGALLLSLLVFPVLYCLPGSVQTRKRRGQWFVHITWRGFINFMKCLYLIDYKVENPHLLHIKNSDNKGQLIIANHPSLIDVVYLIALTPQTNCVVKHSYWRNPFTALVVRMAGYIPNAQSMTTLDACVNALQSGENVIIFPEGTRTTPNVPMQLHRSTAQIALRAGVPLRPVIINNYPTTLTKQERWYHIAPRRVQYLISVREPLCLPQFLPNRSPPLPLAVAARELTQLISETLTRERDAQQTRLEALYRH